MAGKPGRLVRAASALRNMTGAAAEEPNQALEDLKQRLRQALSAKAELEVRVQELETTEDEELRAAKDQRLLDLEEEALVANKRTLWLEKRLKLGNEVHLTDPLCCSPDEAPYRVLHTVFGLGVDLMQGSSRIANIVSTPEGGPSDGGKVFELQGEIDRLRAENGSLREAKDALIALMQSTPIPERAPRVQVSHSSSLLGLEFLWPTHVQCAQ